MENKKRKIKEKTELKAISLFEIIYIGSCNNCIFLDDWKPD